MAISRVITIVIVAASITTCHAIADLTGPTVLLLTPRHGEPYKERVQISLHVDVGEVLARLWCCAQRYPASSFS